MVSRKPRTVLYRRKREAKTRYKKRLNILISKKPRLVARFTNRKVIAQLITFSEKGDKVLVGTDSFSLKKLGWDLSCKNIPAAYLTGYSLAKKAIAGDHKEAVFDTGFRSPKHRGRLYAFLKGALDAGLNLPHGEEEIFPEEAKLKGQHLKSDFSEKFEKVKQQLNG